MNKKQTESIDAENVLREHGFKVTPLRIALLEILSDSLKPLTVSALIKKTKKLGADTATIYRALQAFAEEGLVRSHSLTSQGQSFEFAHSRRHMHHIVCQSCSAIEAIPFCVRGIEANAQIKSRMFKSVTSHSISFGGTCKKCARAVR